MRVAVYTIAKNEAHHIARWAESAREADLLVVADTGSTDDTVAVALANGCQVSTISVDPWRFDVARNQSLALIPDDIDLCIALDADEVLMPGWRQALESMDASITRPRYRYTWSWNADGTPGLVYYGDKIHRRHGYIWRHPVHEVIAATGVEVAGVVGLEIHHHPDPGKGRSYLPLLELSVMEDPDDDRNAHYLGREYVNVGRFEEGAAELKRHLSLPSAQWAAERSRSMQLLASCPQEDTEAWLLRAAAEDPVHREAWVGLAHHYYSISNWTASLAAAERALSITSRNLDYLSDGDCWGWKPHDLAAIASYRMGLHRRAIEHGLDALTKGTDERLMTNLGFYVAECPPEPKVTVIIPTKSNIDAAVALVEQLEDHPMVSQVRVIADGDVAHAALCTRVPYPIYAPLGSGIHYMWNLGMDGVLRDDHILFLNDDVTIDASTIAGMVVALERSPELGLVSPNYSGERIESTYRHATDTCRGRYDGTGGLGGFCMMLRSTLATRWQFDEDMKWWYGDDDLVNWTRRTMGMQVGITSLARCADNSSWTVTNDPPPDFDTIVENDRLLFEQKWGSR